MLILGWGLIACHDRIETSSPSILEPQKISIVSVKLTEVAPPNLIGQLSQSLDRYEPQVKIISPKPDRTLTETTVAVQLQVQDLPIFKDSEFNLGPHLHLILDNEPYQDIYDLDQPILLNNLSPGTHTLRVFAARPWGESFKNDGAYSQTTFHIFTQTNDNNPSPDLPLLTYNLPKGTYGAEPILLDFYLSNAPLHLVARQNPEDEISDWRICITVNGESFLVDNWQSIYLKGLEKGENWIKLEFLDEKGHRIANVFNNTVRVITYNPEYQDTLTQLVRGDISSEIARSIVEPDYRAKLTPPLTPEILPIPPQPPLEETPIPSDDTTEVTPEKEVTEPVISPSLTLEPKLSTEPEQSLETSPIVVEVKPDEEIPVRVEEKPLEKLPIVVETKPLAEESNQSTEPEDKTPIIQIEPTQEKPQPIPTTTPEVETTPTVEPPMKIIIKKDTETASQETNTLSAEPTPSVKIKVPVESTPASDISTAKRSSWLDNLIERVKALINSFFKSS